MYFRKLLQGGGFKKNNCWDKEQQSSIFLWKSSEICFELEDCWTRKQGMDKSEILFETHVFFTILEEKVGNCFKITRGNPLKYKNKFSFVLFYTQKYKKFFCFSKSLKSLKVLFFSNQKVGFFQKDRSQRPFPRWLTVHLTNRKKKKEKKKCLFFFSLKFVQKCFLFCLDSFTLPTFWHPKL